jgi:hypothetical protein
VASLKINALDPTASCIQTMAYPLWRKLYVNSMVDFANAGASAALAQCASVSAASFLAPHGFTPLPATVPGGGTYCEDFNEQMLCGASSNPNGCATNAAAGLPTALTTCGNATVEALEECDNGPSNGPPPATCSVTCRRNLQGPPLWPQGSTLSATETGPTSVQLSWTEGADPNGVTGYPEENRNPVSSHPPAPAAVADAGGWGHERRWPLRFVCDCVALGWLLSSESGQHPAHRRRRR